jgi:hypothetical protein
MKMKEKRELIKASSCFLLIIFLIGFASAGNVIFKGGELILEGNLTSGGNITADNFIGNIEGYVPYSGANQNINLGNNNLTTREATIGTENQNLTFSTIELGVTLYFLSFYAF